MNSIRFVVLVVVSALLLPHVFLQTIYFMISHVDGFFFEFFKMFATYKWSIYLSMILSKLLVAIFAALVVVYVPGRFYPGQSWLVGGSIGFLGSIQLIFFAGYIFGESEFEISRLMFFMLMEWVFVIIACGAAGYLTQWTKGKIGPTQKAGS